LGEHERGEIDLSGELDEPVEGGPPGLNVVVHGSTSAISESPRSIARSNLACSPDDPRKMRGLFIRGSLARLGRDESLDEVERRLGDIAPAVVDGEGVTSVRDP
jgi:hypothetical protein